ELLVRRRGLAALRLGRAAELLIGRRGLPLGGAVGPHRGIRAPCGVRTPGRVGRGGASGSGDRTGPAVCRVGGRRGAIRGVTGQRVLVHGAGGAAAVPRSRAGGVLAQRAVVGIALGAGPTAQDVAVRRVLGRLPAVADVVGGAAAPGAPPTPLAPVVGGRGGAAARS